MSYLCGLPMPVLLGVALWLLTERELPLQVVAAEWQPWGVNMWLLHVAMTIAPVKRQTSPPKWNLLRTDCLYVLLQHISSTLVCLSCLQKTCYYSITFWKKREKKRLQTVWLRSRVQKAATKPKELRFGNKMIEFWGLKLWGPLSVIMMTVDLVLIGSDKTQYLSYGEK